MEDELTEQVDGRKWEPSNPSEQEIAVDCKMEYCDRTPYEALAVPTNVGGVEVSICPDCAKNELGIKHYNKDLDVSQPEYWVDFKTVSAFLSGVLVSMILFSMLVW